MIEILFQKTTLEAASVDTEKITKKLRYDHLHISFHKCKGNELFFSFAGTVNIPIQFR